MDNNLFWIFIANERQAGPVAGEAHRACSLGGKGSLASGWKGVLAAFAAGIAGTRPH